MNQTLRDAFARQIHDAGRVDVDIEALIDRGETRLPRARDQGRQSSPSTGLARLSVENRVHSDSTWFRPSAP